MASYFRITKLDGTHETLMNRRAVDEVLPLSTAQWGDILDGKTVKAASFMGQVEIRMIVRAK